jgi:hypothetical protein
MSIKARLARIEKAVVDMQEAHQASLTEAGRSRLAIRLIAQSLAVGPPTAERYDGLLEKLSELYPDPLLLGDAEGGPAAGDGL